MDGAKGVEEAVVTDHLERSCTSLLLTVAASMAFITEKWSEAGKGTEKWRKSLVIAEGKISSSRVVISL